ncbi:MAG: hypothetical protein CMJ64_29620 [Planctomycetaceae bacterium]|nr:hypothetical protein [Planctomycetaceae bacterium]
MWHLKALVRLGRYEREKIYLKHIAVESPRAQTLFDELDDLPRECLSLSMGPFGSNRPDHITVYSTKEEMRHFTALIESIDVPAN